MDCPEALRIFQRKRKQICTPSSSTSNTTYCTPSSTLPLPQLNEDILIQILNRLPHKTLVKFCTVAKPWLDMISNPRRGDSCYSLRRQSSLNPTLLGFFYTRWSRSIIAPDHNHSTPYVPHELVPTLRWVPLVYDHPPECPSPGNMCFFLLTSVARDKVFVDASSKGYVLYHAGSDFHVANLFMQKQVKLPKVPLKWDIYPTVGFECRVDESSPFAPVQFTVVILGSVKPTGFHVHVFSSDQLIPEWQDIYLNGSDLSGLSPYALNEFLAPQLAQAVKLQGGYYWPCCSGRRLLAFNLSRQQYRVRNLPCNDDDLQLHEGPLDHLRHLEARLHEGPLLLRRLESRLIARLRRTTHAEMLCAVENHLFFGRCVGRYKMSVWRYEGDPFCDGGEWVLNYTIDLREIKIKYPEALQAVEVDNADAIKLHFRGFYSCKPGIIFFIFNDRLMSYEVEREQLVIHGSMGADSCLSRLTTFESCAWPRPLPRIGWNL